MIGGHQTMVPSRQTFHRRHHFDAAKGGAHFKSVRRGNRFGVELPSNEGRSRRVNVGRRKPARNSGSGAGRGDARCASGI